jgi:hypothetical protein
MMNFARTLLLFLLVWSITFPSYAQKRPLFASDELIEMTLTADLVQYAKDRYAKPEYHDATLSYPWEGETITAEVGIRTRGRFRRDICDIPPIKLKLKKEYRNDLFEGQKTLKVVHQCKEIDPEAAVKEYYVYKAYQLFTDISFKVRLIKLTMVDVNGKREPQTQYAFFIEDDDDLAERHGATTIDEDVDLDNSQVDRPSRP